MASPIKSPFKSIANCVKKVFEWGTSTSATSKSDEYSVAEVKDCKVVLVRTPQKSKSKSRSVSPEIPKLEDPIQYVLKRNDDDTTDENMDPNDPNDQQHQTPRNNKRMKRKAGSQTVTPTTSSGSRGDMHLELNLQQQRKRVRRELDTDVNETRKQKRELKKLAIDGEAELLTSTTSSRNSRRISSKYGGFSPEDQTTKSLAPLKLNQVDISTMSSPRSRKNNVTAPQKLVETPEKSSSSKTNTPIKASSMTPKTAADNSKESSRNINKVDSKSVPKPTSTLKRRSSRNTTPAKGKLVYEDVGDNEGQVFYPCEEITNERIKSSVIKTTENKSVTSTPTSIANRRSSRNTTPAKSKPVYEESSESEDQVLYPGEDGYKRRKRMPTTPKADAHPQTPSSRGKKASRITTPLAKTIHQDAENKHSRRPTPKFPSPKTPKSIEKLITKGGRTPRSTRKKLRYDEDKSDDISSDSGSDKDYSVVKEINQDDDDSDMEDFQEDKRRAKKKINSKVVSTPKSKKKKQVNKMVANSKDTPSRRRKNMTPRIPSRSIPLPKDISSLEEAQLRLHVAAVPDSLPCREDEFAQILSFTESRIFDGSSGCMYISGVPGTGKTATVKEVIRTLRSYSDAGDLENFKFIEINGMRLTEPNQTYVQLWKALTGNKVTTEHAKNLLEKRFTNANAETAKKQECAVVLIDELDLLWNRKQSVLYNIFEWPTSNKYAKLIVLAIANTMDLPERLMINRVASRIGIGERCPFSPYTHQQLQEIVSTRLSGLSVFDKDAIQLVARKVASLSGDARRALDICRRAAEIAQRKGDTNLVGIAQVTEAHKEMFCSPKIMAIRCCSKYEKMFLQSMVAVFTKIGIEEAAFERVLHSMNEILKFERLQTLNVDEAHNVVGRLSACRLILMEPGKAGRLDLKLRLNVSQDDVMFALREEKK